MAETISMPKLGFDMAEGTLVRWVRNEGEQINKGDVLAEIETDKATVEVESSASGVVLKLLVDQGAVVPVSTPIAVVGEKGEKVDVAALEVESAPEKEAPAPAETPAPQPAPEPVSSPQGAAAKEAATTPEGRIKASPLARRVAEEKNVNLGAIQGTGPGGRIVRRDIEAALARRISLQRSAVSSPLRFSVHHPRLLSHTKTRSSN